MKKFLLITISIFAIASSQAQGIKDVLQSLGGGKDKGDGNSTVENVLGALGNVLSTDKIDVKSLVGNWHYSAPAVTFKSDNLLKKAGGAAASKVITDKLEPIYKKVGMDKMTLTVNDDNSFTMKVRGISLKGTISSEVPAGSKANFVFNFKVAGKINLGKLETYVVKGIGGNINVMFDISKLITLLEKVSSVANISTVKTLVSALKSYDGLCAGFELRK
ncbi:MAG: DUF4923 family protein [Paramuribaculum sp.]|nr:DUF4923 family protein [Paramuribaculum sp.]